MEKARSTYVGNTEKIGRLREREVKIILKCIKKEQIMRMSRICVFSVVGIVNTLVYSIVQ